jgi:hypothetical protein
MSDVTTLNALQFNILQHPEIKIEDLLRVDNLAVICEADLIDDDGAPFSVYTLAGTLDGVPIERVDHGAKRIFGATVNGDLIVIHGKDRKERDAIAAEGVFDTIGMLMQEFAIRGTLAPGENAGTITEAEVNGPAG